MPTVHRIAVPETRVRETSPVMCGGCVAPGEYPESVANATSSVQATKKTRRIEARKNRGTFPKGGNRGHLWVWDRCPQKGGLGNVPCCFRC